MASTIRARIDREIGLAVVSVRGCAVAMSCGAAVDGRLSPEPPPLSYSVEAAQFSYQVIEPPLPADMVDELMALWARPDVFGHAPDDGEEGTRAQLLGAELPYNRHVLYVARVVRNCTSPQLVLAPDVARPTSSLTTWLTDSGLAAGRGACRIGQANSHAAAQCLCHTR